MRQNNSKILSFKNKAHFKKNLWLDLKYQLEYEAICAQQQ